MYKLFKYCEDEFTPEDLFGEEVSNNSIKNYLYKHLDKLTKEQREEILKDSRSLYQQAMNLYENVPMQVQDVDDWNEILNLVLEPLDCLALVVQVVNLNISKASDLAADERIPFLIDEETISYYKNVVDHKNIGEDQKEQWKQWIDQAFVLSQNINDLLMGMVSGTNLQ